MRKLCFMLFTVAVMLCSCSREPHPADPEAYKALQELKEKYLGLMYGEWRNEMPYDDEGSKWQVSLRLDEDNSYVLTYSIATYGSDGEQTVARKDVTKGTWYLSVVRDDNDGLREVLVLNELQENGTVRMLVDFRDVDNDVLHIDLYPFSELRRAE